jgi:hypothetical protein
LHGLAVALTGPATAPRSDFQQALRVRLLVEASNLAVRPTTRRRRADRHHRTKGGGIRLAAFGIGLSMAGGGIAVAANSHILGTGPVNQGAAALGGGSTEHSDSLHGATAAAGAIPGISAGASRSASPAALPPPASGTDPAQASPSSTALASTTPTGAESAVSSPDLSSPAAYPPAPGSIGRGDPAVAGVEAATGASNDGPRGPLPLPIAPAVSPLGIDSPPVQMPSVDASPGAVATPSRSVIGASVTRPLLRVIRLR